MRQTRHMRHMMLLSLVAVIWLTSGLSLATAGRAVPPEPVPALAPAPPNPHGAERAATPTRKGRPPARASHLPATIVGHDGAPMVLVPAGEFTMGSDEGDDDEQPIYHVVFDSFYLDTFEVTNERFAKFIAAIQSEPP